MRNLKYKIGDFVVVAKTQMRDKQGDNVTWRAALPHITTVPRLGQVVGLCIRFDGLQKCDDSVGVNYLEPSKSHRFWLVRFGLINRAVEVADEDMRVASTGEIYDLPYRWPIQKMCANRKKDLREDSESWPRDARGRWVDGPVVHRR